jgi:PAS domain S-box-containing protein
MALTDSNDAKGVGEVVRPHKTHDSPSQPPKGSAASYYPKLLHQLTESKAKLEEYRIQIGRAIHSLGEGLIELDEHGHIITINPYALKSLGYHENELIGTWFPGTVIAVDRYGQPLDQLNRPLLRALTTGQPISDYVYYLCKDGSIMPVSITVAPILIDDRPKGAIEIFRDLTKEQQLDIAKDEFVSLASHQLRTPATGVKLILSMLAKGDFGPLTSIQQRYLAKAIQSNDRQLQIIEDLLNVARVDAGKMELDFQYADLVPLLREIVGEHLAIVQSRHQSIKLTMPSSFMAFVDVDKVRMAIDNLISNASKYSSLGGQIDVSLTGDTDHAVLSVKDDGVGMDQTDIPKLFTKFTRLENELSTTVGGTGLGLFLVKNIMELHSGTIDVESEKDVGSTFTIRLPRKRVVA